MTCRPIPIHGSISPTVTAITHHTTTSAPAVWGPAIAVAAAGAVVSLIVAHRIARRINP